MTKTSRRRRVLVWVGVITVVMVASLLVGGAIGRNVNQGSAVPTQSTPPSAAPTGVPSTGIPTRGGHPLPLSNVMVAEGGTDEIHGMPIGYPKTMAGAAQAVINYDTALVSPPILVPEQSEAIQNYIYADPERKKALGFSDKALAGARRVLGVSDQAQPIDAEGEPDESKQLYYGSYPEYGAFRVVSAKPSLQSPNPTEVRIQLWKPTVMGTVKPGTTEGLSVRWGIVDKTVKWFNGDWHITTNDVTGPKGPQPEDKTSPITSFEERAQALPLTDGWMLPGNAAEKPIDRLEFPVEPK